MAATSLGSPEAALCPHFPDSPDASLPLAGLQVIRRNGSFSPFDSGKISVAITKAFLAVEGSNAAASRRIHDTVETITAQVEAALARRSAPARPIHIEDIQDQVELALMRSGEHKVARAYVLYREERAARAALTKRRCPSHRHNCTCVFSTAVLSRSTNRCWPRRSRPPAKACAMSRPMQ